MAEIKYSVIAPMGDVNRAGRRAHERSLHLFLDTWEQAKRPDTELLVAAEADLHLATMLHGTPHSPYITNTFGRREIWGRPGICNVVARKSHGRYLVFHYPDFLLPVDFFTRIDNWLARGYTAFLNYSRLLRFRQHEFDALLDTVDAGERVRRIGEYAREFAQYDSEVDMAAGGRERERTRALYPSAGWEGLTAGSITIERVLFESVGGYNAKMAAYGRENDELATRVRVRAGADMIGDREPGDLWCSPTFFFSSTRAFDYKIHRAHYEWCREQREHSFTCAHPHAVLDSLACMVL